jgi:hypothetical protein
MQSKNLSRHIRNRRATANNLHAWRVLGDARLMAYSPNVFLSARILQTLVDSDYQQRFARRCKSAPVYAS